LESENSKKLKNFFGREYHSLKFFVNSKISDSVNRNAEDIIQDVALKLFSGADRYAPINNVAGFVYKSVRNRIIDIMRKPKKLDAVEVDHELFEITTMLHQDMDNPISEEKISILKHCIKQLKPPYRDIIIAVDIEGYTYNEISNETGIPEGTLMSRRHRAIGILYKKIELELKK